MPNGKILWLCNEHSKLPRISVLSTETIQESTDSQEKSSNPEYQLLERLREIEKNIDQEQGNPEFTRYYSYYMNK